MIDSYQVKERDPQKEAVYQSDLCGPVSGEDLPEDAVDSVKEAIWESHVDLPVQPPSVNFSGDRHVYYAWRHEITLGAPKTEKLIHEIAHAKLGALGIGPFVESHGPLFLRVFGKMWSTYAEKPESRFFNRCEDLSLRVADELPNLREHPWAVVREDGMEYAVRPAQRAIEIGWNIVRTFNVNVAAEHPMGKNTDP